MPLLFLLIYSLSSFAGQVTEGFSFDGLGTAANGITIASNGRKFATLVRMGDDTGPRLIELRGTESALYPSITWNDWKPGSDAKEKFVEANALRIGPQGDLWVVDAGAVGAGNPRMPNGPKLIQISLTTDSIARVYDLMSVTKPKSFVDDVRFHGGYAFLSDAGESGLIVLDLQSGSARRVLDDDPLGMSHAAIKINGATLKTVDGKTPMIHLDQLEVSPDGKYLYFQACTGPLRRIETKVLEDAKITPKELHRRITTFAKTRTTGGTAIDAHGTIYSTDPDNQRIIRIKPDGTTMTFAKTKELNWPDALWIDSEGMMWIPDAQLGRTAPFNKGGSQIKTPAKIYKIPIGTGPSPIDHT